MSLISLLSLGGADRRFLMDLEKPLQRVFHAETMVMDAGADVGQFLDVQRNQYNSTSILRFVKEHFDMPGSRAGRRDHRRAYLAVTGHDLFIPILTYVFGEAELDGNVAVVSYYRLQNELYGLPPDKGLLNERLVKEAVHELGHSFGLIHCHIPECVMHASTYAGDIDLKTGDFCQGCRNGLKQSTRRA